MKLSTSEAAGYAAAYLRLALQCSAEEFCEVQAALCEDNCTVSLTCMSPDSLASASFQLDQPIDEDTFSERWNDIGEIDEPSCL